ncbi:hypothetical protein CSKR_100946 [Clonorchis sinensis]|uniref:Uncharacterized protein n=1 Tax=Clonorchis sinensis TaxID=79923 RepID=A0A8T1MG45_CLOSI|nr:hypothetical protein CSKR_100946 [Clonorchis sinensis]
MLLGIPKWGMFPAGSRRFRSTPREQSNNYTIIPVMDGGIIAKLIRVSASFRKEFHNNPLLTVFSSTIKNNVVPITLHTIRKQIAFRWTVMDNPLCFDDDIFVEPNSKGSLEEKVFRPNCVGEHFQGNSSDPESLKILCDWLYFNKQFDRCLAVARNLLDSAPSSGGFMMKFYAECCVRCCLKLKILDVIPELLRQHDSATVSLEDAINHLRLHMDYAREINSHCDILRLLQCLILALPYTSSLEADARLPCIQSLWWQELAFLWTNACTECPYSPWFSYVAELFARLTVAQADQLEWNPDILDEDAASECKTIAQGILKKLRHPDDASEQPAISLVNECPLCRNCPSPRAIKSPTANVISIFYEQFVSPFSTFFEENQICT